MSQFSTLPKDLLIQLLHTIDEDNRKKIQELEKKIEVLQSYKRVLRRTEIDVITCEGCDKVSIEGTPGWFSCIECRDVFCSDCRVSNSMCKLCYDETCPSNQDSVSDNIND